MKQPVTIISWNHIKKNLKVQKVRRAYYQLSVRNGKRGRPAAFFRLPISKLRKQ